MRWRPDSEIEALLAERDERIQRLEEHLRAFPLIPDIAGYTGPRPVWAKWYDDARNLLKVAPPEAAE